MTPDARKLERLDPRLLIKTFKIGLPDGRVWEGTLWQTHRDGGRRIQVRTLPPDSFGLFDSDDCFHSADAFNALDRWLVQFLPPGYLPEVESGLAAMEL